MFVAVRLRGEPASSRPDGEWRDVLGEGTISGTLTLDGIALLDRA